MRLIPAGDLTSAEPVLPIRWCLDAPEINCLKDCHAENAQILFVIKYEGTTIEDRQLVPLDQLMEYLNFRRPGKHTVFAKIIWPWYGNREQVPRSLLYRVTPSRYRNNVLNENGDGFLEEFGSLHGFFTLYTITRGEAEFDVTIPAGHFPKEPPAWLKKLADVGYEYPAFDQCEFRKRTLLLPAILGGMAVWAVVTTLIRSICVLLCALCGMRNIGFAATIHPWSQDIADVFRPITNCWFLYDNDNTSTPKYRPPRYLLLHPFLWFFFFGMLTIAKNRSNKTYAELLITVFSSAQHGAIQAGKYIHNTIVFWVILVLFIALFCKVISRAAKEVERRRSSEYQLEQIRIRAELEKRHKQEEQEARESTYSLLVCKPNLVADIATLPTERQTFHLRFLKMKAKVCRPWAAS